RPRSAPAEGRRVAARSHAEAPNSATLDFSSPSARRRAHYPTVRTAKEEVPGTVTMTEGRSRFTNRVMEAVRADDRALAGRRRRVTRGLAAVMLLGGVLCLMQEPRSTTAPGGEGREAWLAVVEDAAPGASGPAVAES